MTTYTSLQQIVEEATVRKARARVLIGGAELPKWTSITYTFAVGEVPTASIVVPGLRYLPAAVVEEASVEIWFGYQVGLSFFEKLVFGGAVVDSVGTNGAKVTIDCVMDGPRKLTYGYNRRISVDFDTITAVEAVTQLMTLAGVSNYFVDLETWLIGTAVPYTLALANQIQFSTYGEAINKVAEVDGSPWFALPSGQVRVENHPGIPNNEPRRTYFTGVLTGPFEDSPTVITNADARPLISDIQRRKFRSQVGNFIHIEGAVVVSLGPNGEQNSNQIIETVDGSSGRFPNGAYWIPTPPLFQDFSLQNELIDTDAKAFEVAERYFNLKNRLFEELPIAIPGDPDVFLCETIRVVDPSYSQVDSLYFVKGYTTTIDSSSAMTTLQLTGGPEAGTIGFAAPFAEFTWKYQEFKYLVPGYPDNPSYLNLGPNSDVGAKFCEPVPTGTGLTSHGAPGTDTRMIQITLDGTSSNDFDGVIVTYAWEWIDSAAVHHFMTGPIVTLMIDPLAQSSVEVKLTVTDNTARQGSITKHVSTAATAIVPNDPTLDDTPKGGGVGIGDCTVNGKPDQLPDSLEPGRANGMEVIYFVASDDFAMGTLDLITWNDLTKAAAGVTGEFISVASGINFDTQKAYGIFGTTEGEVVLTEDICVTGTKVFQVPGSPRIECIVFDQSDSGRPSEGTDWGVEGGYVASGGVYSPKYGSIPVYTAGSPGTMTIEEAYQQCLAVGFDPSAAVIATAIMKAESSLISNATNTAGNNPPSTDRGIVQINSYYHPEVSDACAFNTECAIKEFFRISSGGTDFTPWTTYTGGAFRRQLAQVQNAVGVVGAVGDKATGTTRNNPRSLAVWLGTSDGRIYRSTDSGRTWERWVDFGDGLPIRAIKSSPILPGLWAFGGDTGRPDTVIRIDLERTGNFTALPISGDLRKAMLAAPGFTCNSAALNFAGLAIGFTGGLSDPIWFSSDPLSQPDSWQPTTNFTGTVETIEPGFELELVAAGSDGSWNSINSAAWVSQGAPPSAIHHMAWEGLEGVYLAAAQDNFLKSVDLGVGWGSLRPNATFGTTWPSGALGRQVSLTIGPRDVSGGDHQGGGSIIPPSGSWTGATLYTGSEALLPDHFYFITTHANDGPSPTPVGIDVTVSPLDTLLQPNCFVGGVPVTKETRTWLVKTGSSPTPSLTPVAGGYFGCRLDYTGTLATASQTTHAMPSATAVITVGVPHPLFVSIAPGGTTREITVSLFSGSTTEVSTPYTDGTTPAPTPFTNDVLNTTFSQIGARPSWSWSYLTDAGTAPADGFNEYAFAMYLVMRL